MSKIDLGSVSAFDIAVKNGYAGTEADWVNDIANASGSSVTIDTVLSSTSENPVQNKVIDSALGRRATAFPHRTNAVTDIHNAYSVHNAYKLGTNSTLRHNLMLEGDSNYIVATWTQSTGTKDYADSSGQTSVYAKVFRDKFGERNASLNATIMESEVYDIFPIGDTIYGADGNALGTVVASSDSTVKMVGNTFYFLAIAYGSDNEFHIVYRTASQTTTPGLTLGASINVCKIGEGEWDMRTLGHGYTNKTSQVNTYIVKRVNTYYMPIVQSGVGIAIMTSEDCVTWSLLKHIPDTDAHLEASLCVLGYVSNNACTVFLAVRHNYKDGYLTLYGYRDLNFQDLISKSFIPASTGRPMMVSDSNAKKAFLAYSVNGRRNAVFVRLSSNNDGNTGYEFLVTPQDIMSNYPCVALGNNMLWIGGTDGLGSDKKGVSVAPIWLEELKSYKTMEDDLTDVLINGALVAPANPSTGQVMTWDGEAWVAADLPLYNGGVS